MFTTKNKKKRRYTKKIKYNNLFKALDAGSLCPFCKDDKLEADGNERKNKQARVISCPNCYVDYLFTLDNELIHRDKLYCIIFTTLAVIVLRRYGTLPIQDVKDTIDMNHKNRCPVCVVDVDEDKWYDPGRLRTYYYNGRERRVDVCNHCDTRFEFILKNPF